MRFYSPLRYPGGKTRIADFLAEEFLVRTKDKKIIFVEPFAGGAGAALKLLLTRKVSKIVINDLDPGIHAFWEVAVNDTDRLISKIKTTRVSITEWKRQRTVYGNFKKYSKFDLGFAVFFLNRTNVSGIIEGGPIGGLNQKGKWKINARFNKKELIKRLEEIKSHRSGIEVTNMDGIELLKSIQRRSDFSEHFIFLDPPYFDKGQFLYLNHYQKGNHKNLADFLDSSSLNWVMTYDNVPFIKELYKKQEMREFDIPHTARTRKNGKELLIAPSPIFRPVKICG